jgi:gas vesicle protein
MKDNKSNILLYGLIIGGLVGAGVAIYFGSRYFNERRKRNRFTNNKFYEGIEDIFESKHEDAKDDDTLIDKETEKDIIDQLFSKTN